MAKSVLKIKGFLRGQIVDKKSKKICGDTGWIENRATNDGLINYANAVLGTDSLYLRYGALGTQTDAVNQTQTDLLGRFNSFQALDTSSSGVCTATFTCSFEGTNGAGVDVGAAGLFQTNSAGSMYHAQTFASSSMSTNQDFNLTYQVRFATV